MSLGREHTFVSARITPPCDLFATVTKPLGLDPDKSFDTPSGRPIEITDGGRVLPEIMG